MKVYYIDDSFFQKSHFSQEMYERLLTRMKRVNKGLVCISSSHQCDAGIQRFKEEISQGWTVVESPAVFDVDGIRGNLRVSYLALENFENMYAYSGSLVEYDTNEHECMRIYLDLFPEHSIMDDLDFMMDQLEDVISKKVKNYRKKKDYIC